MSITKLRAKYQAGERITMMTCYDYPMANVVAKTGIDAVLVGDTLAMVVHGHETTTTATLAMMELHTAAVARAKAPQFIVADLPFLCANLSVKDTLQAAGRLIQAGAQAVKMEGCEQVLVSMKACVQSGIPVMAHLGLMPQHVHQLGGWRVQGKTEEAKEHLLWQAKECEKAGAFALVLECVPSDLAERITEEIAIPTIGIGAGKKTSGQILVLHDLLGFTSGHLPKFVRQFLNGSELCQKAIDSYVESVSAGDYPAKEHEYS